MAMPETWVPTAGGSQLLYDLIEPIEAAVTPLDGFTAIQDALDDDYINGRSPNLPGGEITHTASLMRDGGVGGGIAGRVRTELISLADDDAVLGTTFFYAGTKASNEAAFDYSGSDFFIRDLSFQGKTTAQLLAGTGTKTPRGIYIHRDAEVGTGKLDISNVRFSGFETAIECGNSLAAANCDESAYYSVLINLCTRGFRSNNAQGLSHKWYNLRVGQVDTVFDYIAGGKMEVFGLELLGSPTTLLQLRNDEPTGFGTNGSRWVFHGTNLDSDARNSKLLDIESGIGYYAHVVFNGGHFSRNGADVWDNYAWHIGDNMHVTINDFHNLMGGMIKYTTTVAKSSITINCGTSLEGQITTEDDLFDPASSGPSPMVIINNLMPNNGQTPLNFSGTL